MRACTATDALRRLYMMVAGPLRRDARGHLASLRAGSHDCELVVCVPYSFLDLMIDGFYSQNDFVRKSNNSNIWIFEFDDLLPRSDGGWQQGPNGCLAIRELQGHVSAIEAWGRTSGEAQYPLYRVTIEVATVVD